jgi:hypothetical protein
MPSVLYIGYEFLPICYNCSVTILQKSALAIFVKLRGGSEPRLKSNFIIYKITKADASIPTRRGTQEAEGVGLLNR